MSVRAVKRQLTVLAEAVKAADEGALNAAESYSHAVSVLKLGAKMDLSLFGLGKMFQACVAFCCQDTEKGQGLACERGTVQNWVAE